jgi:hypothetical protein
LDREFKTDDERKIFMEEVFKSNYGLKTPPIEVNGSIAYSQQTPWI